MKTLTLFGQGEALWHQLRARLGLRAGPSPLWLAPHGATPPGGGRARRLLEQTAIARAGQPLDDYAMRELAANFPGLYPELELDDGGSIR